MRPGERDRLDRALGDTAGFSGPEKEQMMAAVLARLEGEGRAASAVQTPAPGRRWIGWLAAPVAAAAALAIWIVLPDNDGPAAPTLQSRGVLGSGGTGESWVSIKCPGGAPERCPSGAALHVAIAPLPHTGYAAVAAIGPDKILTWYYPDADGRPLPLVPGRLTTFSITLDPRLPPGGHELFVLVSEAPPTRPKVRTRVEGWLDEAGGIPQNIAVVPFTIEPPPEGPSLPSP